MGLLRHLTTSLHKPSVPCAMDVYQKWLKTDPKDIGVTTKTALTTGLAHKTSLSNGSLMRCSPLALYGLTVDDQKLKEAIKLDVNCFHSILDVVEAVTAYVFALREIIKTGDIGSGFISAKANVKESLVLSWIESKNRFPVLLENGEVLNQADARGQGYIGLAFQLAMVEAVKTKNLERSLVEIISLGGDTDTNGCIVGALLGGIYGFSAFPADWIETIMKPNRYGNDRLEKFP